MGKKKSSLARKSVLYKTVPEFPEYYFTYSSLSMEIKPQFLKELFIVKPCATIFNIIL